MHSSVHATENLLFLTLLQLIVMVLAARLGNNLARRFGQPGAVGEIVAGLMLGPSLFGHFMPEASLFLFGAKASTPITIISQIGLVLLMFQIGMDFEFGHLSQRRNRHGSLGITVASISVPFALGFALGQLSAPVFAPHVDSIAYSLFCGVGLAITAVPILGRILKEYELTRTEIGVVAISAAALNDVVGWILLAGISAYAAAKFSLDAMALQIGGILLLAAFAWFGLRRAIHWLLAKYPVLGGEVPPNLMTLVIAITFSMAICTYQLGIFAIFGGFLAGLLFHHDHAFVEAWRRQVGRFVLVFFLPVFFTYTGLRTNILGLTTMADWGWALAFLGAAVFGKILPVFAAAKLARFSTGESAVLGALMNTRALMELIVLNIGYDLGLLPQNVFTMLVIMAVVTTIMTGPLLRLLLPRAGYAVPQGVEA
ncbi:Kef-type K+ transport system membrane component KefB [Rhizomicrobium palustre]|uniref:Kef-type K+ transport system membrane component KefB n=1 Tax=Rhizomicrobium palustre TaxID=189966 RepID=A0A846MZY1_9PROT|nr:cation:proton antiporter [Rhizomicrobium palustre]NIK88661.1 Kef-type K+ transport system membrane component KefB [Rhizomicrobium palustre]